MKIVIFSINSYELMNHTSEKERKPKKFPNQTDTNEISSRQAYLKHV